MFGDRKHNWPVSYSKAVELVFPQQLGPEKAMNGTPLQYSWENPTDGGAC